MIFLYAIAVGITFGYLAGGRLRGLALLPLRASWLVLVALGIQFLIFPLFAPQPLFPYATTPLHGLSYALAVAWLIVNRRQFPLLVVGLGAGLNGLAVLANQGHMPSSPHALERAGLATTARVLADTGTYGNLVEMGAATRLNWLGDRFALPSGWPFATAFSVGDLLIGVGLAWLIARGMRRYGR
ncbi:MAG: DUF5317 domain-containing protein [Candidatus Bipolaricaulota bacterium]